MFCQENLKFKQRFYACYSFPTGGDFCCLLITFANSLDLDQARQNFGPHGRIQRGAGGLDPPPLPLKNHKNIGLLSNTGPDPLKITKLPSQHSLLGHNRHAREMPFKWHFAGGLMMAGF